MTEYKLRTNIIIIIIIIIIIEQFIQSNWAATVAKY